jgi:hypothetical protein
LEIKSLPHQGFLKTTTMTISGIFASPWQKKRFLLASCGVITVCIVAILSVAIYAPNTPIWNSLNDLFISIVASAVFAVVAALYISYFFTDPSENDRKTTILAQDIGPALRAIASTATHYRIFVRTGRHFRAEILPLLEKQAREHRRPIKVEIVLLDCRDNQVCGKYSDYRRSSSFDSKDWSREYVQAEVLSTILALLSKTETSRSFVEIHLFLSKRLSAFRIDGSEENILVTREDPKDTASTYPRGHRDFGAYLTEFRWIKEEASHISLTEGDRVLALSEIFEKHPQLLAMEESAKKARTSPSSYAR